MPKLQIFGWPPTWPGLAGKMRRRLKTVASDFWALKLPRVRRVAVKKASADQRPVQGLRRIALRRPILAPVRGGLSIAQQDAGF